MSAHPRKLQGRVTNNVLGEPREPPAVQRTTDSKPREDISLLFLGFDLRETEPDSDGLFGGLLLPRAQYVLLWRVSFLSFLSGVVALVTSHSDLCFVPFGVWLTSINYWRKPDHSWRRYVDIVYVQCALWYQIWRAVGAEHAAAYYALTLTGIVCFFVGAHHRHTSKSGGWLATLWHVGVHVFGNAGNIVLYLGAIRPLHQ